MSEERKSKIDSLLEQKKTVELEIEKQRSRKYELEREIRKLQELERDEAYKLQRALDKSPEAVMLKAEQQALGLRAQEILDNNKEYQEVLRLCQENQEKIWELQRRIKIPSVIPSDDEDF